MTGLWVLKFRLNRDSAGCIKEGLGRTDRMLESRWHTHHTMTLERDTAGGCQDTAAAGRGITV